MCFLQVNEDETKAADRVQRAYDDLFNVVQFQGTGKRDTRYPLDHFPN